MTFDFGYGDPDLPATSDGNTASATFKTPAATPGLWSIAPTPAGGPFSAPVPKGTVSTGQRGTMILTITPSKKAGKVVNGTLYIDVLDNGPLTLIGGEVVAIPYSYTVG